MRKTDCENCMYASHISGIRKMGQSVFGTSGNGITCTRETVHNMMIDDEGLHCSDFEPMIEGSIEGLQIAENGEVI